MRILIKGHLRELISEKKLVMIDEVYNMLKEMFVETLQEMLTVELSMQS